jgi:hypothetical protein
MSNTISSRLLQDFYAALDVVSRELAGFIPAVARDSTADKVAKDQGLIIPITPANAARKTITPAMSLPAAAAQTIGHVELVIDNYDAWPFSWNGEEEKAVNAGPGILTVQQDQIAQAIRAAVNYMELGIATAAYKAASRAYGTATNIPFPMAGDYSDAAQTRKILDDNGAPISDRHLVLNTAAGANIRGKQAQAHIAGETSLQRQGILYDINGFSIRESAQIVSHTAGTLSGGNTTGALTVGQTVLPLKNATGTGAAVAGDIITLANDSNKYVVASVSQAGANPATGDTITIAQPGIRMAQGSADRVITMIASGPRNVAFTRNSILLGTRLPYVPAHGDLASDRMDVTDPMTGLSFGLAYYPGYMMGLYEIQVAWGVKVIKPEHIAVLLG